MSVGASVDTGSRVFLGTQKVTLGKALFKGGEGAVYTVVENADLLVKIFFTPQAADVDKIEWMARHATSGPSGTELAWPRSAVFRAAGDRGTFLGVAMRRVNGSLDLENFGNPSARIRELQKLKLSLDRKNLHEIALNLVKAIEHAHKCGVVFPDLNPKNVLINPKTRSVGLIDLDSAVIATGPLRNVRSAAVYDGYLAPELLEGTPESPTTKGLDAKDRTLATDSFVTGIHLFRLLFGVHPYEFRVINGHSKPSVTPNGLVIGGAFPYGKDRNSNIAPPPAEEARGGKFEWLAPELQRAFERCFARNQGHATPSLRPADKEWRAACESALAALTKCRKGHWFTPAVTAACPYCQAGAASGVPAGAKSGGVGPAVQPLRQAVQQVIPKSAAVPPITPSRSPAPASAKREAGFGRWLIGGAVIAAIALIVAMQAGWFGTGSDVRSMVPVIGSGGDTVDRSKWQTSDSPNGGNSTYVIDQNVETVWRAVDDDTQRAWVQLDLGKRSKIEYLRWFIPKGGSGTTVRILISDDGSTWSEQRVIVLAKEDIGQFRRRGLNVTTRYVRLEFTGWKERGVAAEVAELEVLGPGQAVREPETGPTATQIAVGGGSPATLVASATRTPSPKPTATARSKPTSTPRSREPAGGQPTIAPKGP